MFMPLPLANKKKYFIPAFLTIAAFYFLWQVNFLGQIAGLSLRAGNYYFNVYGDGVYDLDKAQKYFNLALKIYPKVPDAWHQLARIDFLRGDYAAALQKINKQIEIHGDNFMASYYIRGLIYGYAGRLDEAEKDFLKFLEWDSKNWAAHNDLAWIYFQKGDYDSARTIAQKGLVFAPANPWLLTIYGASLINLEQKEEARIALEQALNEALKLTEKDWHRAYPGNDPRIAGRGIKEMISAIQFNLGLIVDK